MSDFELTDRQKLEVELSRLRSFLAAIAPVWAEVEAYFEPTIRDSIQDLIKAENSVLRGRIQAMQLFAGLPDRVRDQISTVELELAGSSGLQENPLL